MKFPEFSRFSRPSKQSFPCNYKVKTPCNESPLQSFRYFSCRTTEYILSSMVTGCTTVAAQTYTSACCGFQTVSRKIASDIQKFHEYISNSLTYRRVSENLHIPRDFHVFQSCKQSRNYSSLS